MLNNKCIIINNKCIIINNNFNNIEDDCVELVPYGIQVRYLYQLELIESDINAAIQSAERIQKFIISTVK